MSDMTNGIRKNNRIFIKEANLHIGKLYEIDESNEIALYESEDNVTRILYDGGTGNFHLLPEKDNFHRISDEINTMMKAIIEKLHKKLKEVKGITYVRPIHGVGGHLHHKNKPEGFDGGHLFAYIRVCKDNIDYDLMPIRFYINSKDNTVNCVLKAYQFCRNASDKSYMQYPLSCENGEDRIGIAPLYYNPDTSFEYTDKIVEEFLKFVIEN